MIKASATCKSRHVEHDEFLPVLQRRHCSTLERRRSASKMKIYPGGATQTSGSELPASRSRQHVGHVEIPDLLRPRRGGFWCIDANCTWARGGRRLWEGRLAEGTGSFMGFDKCCHTWGLSWPNRQAGIPREFLVGHARSGTPSPTVSPTTSVVPTVSVPPTRADDCAQPDGLACDAYLDECHTIMNPLEGACDYGGAQHCGLGWPATQHVAMSDL